MDVPRRHDLQYSHQHSFVSPYGAPVCIQRGLQPFPTISAVSPNEYCSWQPVPGRLHDDDAETTVLNRGREWKQGTQGVEECERNTSITRNKVQKPINSQYRTQYVVRNAFMSCTDNEFVILSSFFLSEQKPGYSLDNWKLISIPGWSTGSSLRTGKLTVQLSHLRIRPTISIWFRDYECMELHLHFPNSSQNIGIYLYSTSDYYSYITS